MALFPGNLINIDVGDATQIPAGKIKGDHLRNSGSNRTPGILKMPGYRSHGIVFAQVASATAKALVSRFFPAAYGKHST